MSENLKKPPISRKKTKKVSLKIQTDEISDGKTVFTSCSTISSPLLTRKGQTTSTNLSFTEKELVSEAKPANFLTFGEIYEVDLTSDVPNLEWCAYCRADIKTTMMYANNSKTFWSAVAIFMSGGIFGCFLIPYLTKSCKSLQVLCSKCGHRLH